MDVQNIRSVDGEDRRWKLFHHRRENRQALKCPRCDSLDTKFCYYNNYNFSQPRHFCKTCRRYWTMGGILRNVPVGGGSRKSKNSKVKPALVGASPSSNSNSNSHTLGNTHLGTDNATGLGNDAPSALPLSTVFNSLSATSDLETATLRTQESDLGMSSKMDSLRSLARSSNERSVPFVFSYIQGATPLELSDYCDWIEE